MPKDARINERIRVKEVRVIGPNGEQLGVLSVSQGLKIAQESGLDLVEVAPTSTPPVCRIMDYSKYKYEQAKKAREARKRQRVIHIKEIKLRPNIEEHDYQVKLHHLERFLKRGDKVKVTLTLRGRERAHPEIGQRILERFVKDLWNIGGAERGPVTEGRNVLMVLSPK